jgi:TPP-dependent pyruvate/acetoin dehydrogenase alpha subunit
LGANGIVGGGIPIATGAAFASQFKKTGQVTACFFGEGASDEGAFHESLNIASLRKLPIVYVCENNQWAQFTPQDIHMPIKDVAKRAESYNIPGEVVANDFFDIYAVAREAIQRARKGDGPTLLEVKCNRWYGHFVGDAQKYRHEESVKAARREDCILKLEKALLKDSVLKKQDIEKMEKEIQEEITEAVEFARSAPLPDDSELLRDLYV